MLCEIVFKSLFPGPAHPLHVQAYYATVQVYYSFGQNVSDKAVLKHSYLSFCVLNAFSLTLTIFFNFNVDWVENVYNNMNSVFLFLNSSFCEPNCF